MKVAILHQGCIPTYRKSFFEKLGSGYVVFHGQSMEGIRAAQPPFSFANIEVRNRRFGKVIYQPVFWRVATGGYDAIVISHEVKYVSNLALALWFRLTRRPVILWGFGRNVRGPAWLQRLLVYLATDYLVYTASGAAELPMALDRITVLRNTIDMELEIKAHAEACLLDRDHLRRQMGLAPHAIVFVFVGRPLPEKRVDLLVEAVRTLRLEGFAVEAMVVTDVYERDQIARIFCASDAMVIPGYVGLAVCHAFAHGLPVITCANPLHSPEIEYLQEGVNGLMVPAESQLVDTLRDFATSPALREGLERGALKSREKLGLDHMIDAFNYGVGQAVSRPKLHRNIGNLFLDIFVGLPLIVGVLLFFVVGRLGRKQ